MGDDGARCDRGPGRLLLSSYELPPAGGHVAFSVLNETDDAISFGLVGQLDRWDGQHWQRHAPFSGWPCWWSGVGHVWSGGAQMVPDIGLGAPACGAGPLEWLQLELDPGWWRLSQAGVSACLRVRDGAHPSPVERGREDVELLLSPLTTSGGPVVLRALDVLAGAYVLPADDGEGGLPPVDIEVVREGTWTRLHRVPSQFVEGTPESGVAQVQVGGLQPGLHRASRPGNDGRLQRGLFWVLPGDIA